jgi:L-aminopeptidase/D-esterase-like protein
MKAWILALAVIAATADLKVRTTPAFTPAASDVVQAFPPALASKHRELRRGTPEREQREAGRPAANSTLTAIPGIKVGHYTLAERPTGCTVVLIEQGATAGVDVRGAAPATRDTDLLNPTKMVERIYGVALSGGSTFGLSTGDGVLRYLEEHNVGIVYGNRHIPIVPGASIFDLGVGDARIRPTADCGYRAAQAATSAPVTEGSVGAGAGATLGKIAGMERAMKGGIGAAAIEMQDGLIVAALVVANPMGDVIDPADGRVVAGARNADGRGFADARRIVRTGVPRGRTGDNSTIGVIATNARLTKAQASYLAQMTDDGYARAIWPIHTMVDGDAVFAIATGSKAGEPDMITIGSLAADVMATAIIRAATQATGLPNLPAVRDLK